MSSGERLIGAAKGTQSDPEALCQPPPPPFPLCRIAGQQRECAKAVIKARGGGFGLWVMGFLSVNFLFRERRHPQCH